MIQAHCNVSINVNGKSVEVERAKLRLWFNLEDMRSKLKEAVEGGDTQAVSLIICSYLSAASNENIEIFQDTIWEEVAIAFADVCALNSPRLQFPLFNVDEDKPLDTVSWDYEGRLWYLWVHLLAKAYGWTAEYIAELEIEDGLAFIQETTVEDQLRKEWEWSLSEMAYEYNKAAKTSQYKPLPRPNWMRAIRKEPKKTKMLKMMLPFGPVENLSGMGIHGTDENVVH
jgi:hypothetical protein